MALALVPEAVAFSLIAGVPPLVGLYVAFVMGLVTSVLGGRPGMISGATGAVAVVLVALARTHGVEYIFATVILAGIMQVLAGVFRLGKFIRLVPHSTEVVIDFKESRVADMSAIEALNKLTERYHRAGKTLHLRHLSPDCRVLLSCAGSIIDVNIQENPIYHVAGANVT